MQSPSRTFLTLILLAVFVPSHWVRSSSLLDRINSTPRPLLAGSTFTVTKTNDSNDGSCNADCSLREAIIAANQTPEADTITLPAGIFTLTIPGAKEDFAATGDLDITSPMTITGAGAGRTVVDGGQIDRVLQLWGSYSPVTISDLALRNGKTDMDGGGFTISNGDTTTLVTLNRVVVRDNSAGNGGGIAQPNGGRLVINQSTIANNATTGQGGGIQNYAASIELVNSTISSNTASGGGGGGGIYSYFDMDHVDCTIITLRNTTITANTSTASGAGVANFVGRVILSNSIIAGNFGVDASGAISDMGGVQNGYITEGYNIVQSQTQGAVFRNAAAGDLLGVDPKLGPLMNNGGPTPTHVLLPGSPAINTGSPDAPASSGAACRVIDQRGVARPQESRCDIGAYELTPDGTIGGVVYNLVTRVREPGITVQLQSTDAGNPTSKTETSDLNGEVSFLNIPPGNYILNLFPPDGWIGGGKLIMVTEHDQSTYRLVLRKEIPLVYPANNSPVETPQPVLCWEGLPQVRYYVLQVKDASQVLLANPTVFDTCYTLDQPLQDGKTYTWSLAAAVDQNGESIGGSKSFQFTYYGGQKTIDVAPQAESTLTSFDTTTQFVFPAGTFTTDGMVTYEHPSDPPPAVYPLTNTQKVYDISSAAPLANDVTYQVDIEYNPMDVRYIDPSTLALYYWDPVQNTWVLEPTSQHNPDTQTITANPSHFSLWSVMGETNRLYLSVISR